MGVPGVSGMTVDGQGNLFYAMEGGFIEMVSAQTIASGQVNAAVELYHVDKTPSVSNPMDIATDGYHVYWANKLGGEVPGTVAVAPEMPGGVAKAVASNDQGAVGLCLARGNIFYTGNSAGLFAVKQTGGPIAEISKSLTAPQSCVYDGEGTVYVADSGDNHLYSFPAVLNIRPLRKLTKVTSVDSPSHIVIFAATDNDLQGEVQDQYNPDMAAAGPRYGGGGSVNAAAALVALCLLF
jgi:hypothetical protein